MSGSLFGNFVMKNKFCSLFFLQFNSVRVYGPVLHSHLFSNWCQIHRGPILRPYNHTHSFKNQPVHVIQKISNLSEEYECLEFYSE